MAGSRPGLVWAQGYLRDPDDDLGDVLVGVRLVRCGHREQHRDLHVAAGIERRRCVGLVGLVGVGRRRAVAGEQAREAVPSCGRVRCVRCRRGVAGWCF